MSLNGALRASRLFIRAAASAPPTTLRFVPCAAALRQLPSLRAAQRSFAASSVRPRGIMPHTENPVKPDPPETKPSYGVVDLSEKEYHELADTYLDTVLAKFELLQDSREDIDIEFSAGVMTITVADKGTYVINKQPSNKQIWLSSPITGPKRYDWCIIGESQGEKEGTGTGDWIYTREGKSLNQLILKELEVAIEEPVQV